jgi:hypothetical protein
LEQLGHGHPKRGLPVGGHASRSCRLPPTVYPQVSGQESISQGPTIHRLRHCPPPPKRDGTTGRPPRHAESARVPSFAAAFRGRDASLLTPITGRHAAVLRWNSPEGVFARGILARVAPDKLGRPRPPTTRIVASLQSDGRLLNWEVVGRGGLELGSNHPEAFASLLSALSPHSYTHRACCALTIALNGRRVISRPENRSAAHTNNQVRGRFPYNPSRQSCGAIGCLANAGCRRVGGGGGPCPAAPRVAGSRHG